MLTLLRRTFWLALLGGAGYGGWTAWQRRNAPAASPAPPTWPPIDTTPKSEAGAARATEAVAFADTSVAAAGVRWVAPVDGACPDGYPIKANDNSGIFHVPGGRFYQRTVAERCYANADDAVADGYRAAKA